MNYVALAAVAKRLIEKNGKLAVITRSSETPADVQKPWRGTGPDTDPMATVEAKAVVIGIDSEDAPKELVRNASEQAFVSTEEDLSEFDCFEQDSRIWKIIKVQEVKPADVRLVWRLFLQQ